MNKSAKNVLTFIYRKLILPSCFLFTVLSFATMTMIEGFDSIKLDKASILLLFSVAICLSNLILYLKNMNIFMRAALHFVCYTASFGFIMLYGSGNFEKNSSGSMMLMIAFIVLYLLIAPVPIYMIYRGEKKNEKKPEYKSIYKKADEE